ncbi:hypothetical protein HUJ04_003840 [Dendroctonus ponderosae]
MFKGDINFQELIASGTTFEVDTSKPPNNDDLAEITEKEYKEEVLKYCNFNCLGEFEDDDVYDSREPFSILASKMSNLWENGDIKHRILRAGYGNKPQEHYIVKVHYNAYTEFNEEPFDCTYARKRPHVFVIGSGEVLPGLDYAVQSMQLNEKSQFLIKPHLAYGDFGCMERIAPNATVLFEIELLEIIESKSNDFQNLPEEEKNDFSQVYNFCLSQCTKGKKLFSRNITSAIREYNIAVAALEKAQLEQYDEQVKQQELLYKLYSNLLVCYTKNEEPRKGCINFNKIKYLACGKEVQVSAKAYFNNAKCLRMLGEYDLAKSRLQKAYDLEPRNSDILQEFKVIDREHKKYQDKQKLMANAFVNTEK